ncbi:MAG: hypothetical protein AAGJ10_09080 [Bacteroidota bacterium]
MTDRQFPCGQCGADLKFAPGQEALQCPYCGHLNDVPVDDEVAVEELDFRAHLEAARAASEVVETMVVDCPSCGAETTLAEGVVADECPFCGSSLVRTAHAERIIKPQAVLPFRVTDREARAAFGKWVKGLWFAPNKVKEFAREEGGLSGMYIPYWTYDSDTKTRYTGQRGDYYYTTQTYTAVEDGKTVTKTRQVRHTRWRSASGTVRNVFDDVLVPGSTSLPRKLLDALEPWDLEALAPYDDAYLSGFRAEAYAVNLEAGFRQAQQIMAVTIDQTIRRDIGGDEQRIHRKNTDYRDITFKHILLPVWVSAYRFDDKVYRFIVNARTGEVKGERPWSWIKITLAVIVVLIIAAVVYFVTQDPSI